MSIAVVVSWICSLFISFATPYLFQTFLHEYTFLLFGFICLLACLFFGCFMKETRGLSSVQCKLLYSKPGSFSVP